MKALLTKNYIYHSPFYGYRSDYQNHLDFKAWIKENQGKWIDIDTTHLFDNQYNSNKCRVYDIWIDEIKGDVRTGNQFFVKHPKGKDDIKDCDFKDHLKNKRFYSCYSVNKNYYRISRRSSIEFILVGDLIYTTNGIGYNELNKSRLSNNEIKIVQYCASKISKL